MEYFRIFDNYMMMLVGLLASSFCSVTAIELLFNSVVIVCLAAWMRMHCRKYSAGMEFTPHRLNICPKSCRPSCLNNLRKLVQSYLYLTTKLKILGRPHLPLHMVNSSLYLCPGALQHIIWLKFFLLISEKLCMHMTTSHSWWNIRNAVHILLTVPGTRCNTIQ